MSAATPSIIRIAGALADVRPMPEASLYEIVRVGERRLLGEVIRTQHDVATVQVFEDTTGLALGEPVESTGAPLQALLGPGLLGAVLDGTGRGLPALAQSFGNFLSPGADAPMIDPERRWYAYRETQVIRRLSGALPHQARALNPEKSLVRWKNDLGSCITSWFPRRHAAGYRISPTVITYRAPPSAN